MKNILYILFTFLVLNKSYASSEQDSLWVHNNYKKVEYKVPMRDGVHLFTSVYIPDDASEKHPFLITRTPYTAKPYGPDFHPNLWKSYWKYYARENYIVVIQDVRGKWLSEGEFENVRPYKENKIGSETDESTDAYDTIEWLIKNIPNNNERAGVFGISYPGFYTTQAALSGHPALKAVSPQGPVTDWFHGDDFHHNGAFFLMDCFGFFTKGFGFSRPQPTQNAPVSLLKIPKKDNYKTFLDIGPLPEFTKLTGDSISVWKDLIAHPNYDDFWKQRNIRNYVKDLKPAVLVVGGLFDAENLFGAWNLYRAIEEKNPKTSFNKLVMGPWYHGQWAAEDGTHLGQIEFGANTAHWYQNEIEIPFFNYHLKDKGDISKLAEATVFITGSNEWKSFEQWPPQSVKNTPVFLDENNTLSWNKSSKSNSYNEYVSDPANPVPYTSYIHYVRTRDYMVDDQRFAARRPDVLTFETSVLEEDLTLAGPVVANLFASISSTDADFVVKIIDVFPDDFTYPNAPAENQTRDAGGPTPLGGYQQLVRGEVIRGKFRNSLSEPIPFVPEKTEKVALTLPDVAHTFKKGHRLQIQIQSSWFPLVDRNPQKFINIYEAKADDFQKATVRIHHSKEHSSHLVLPVLK